MAARTRIAISERLGHSFTLAGQTVQAFPQPDALSGLTNFPGLDQTKARRLHKIADAGAELQADALKSRGPEDAFIYAQTLEGIGPFYASLIVLRAAGFADAVIALDDGSNGIPERARNREDDHTHLVVERVEDAGDRNAAERRILGNRRRRRGG